MVRAMAATDVPMCDIGHEKRPADLPALDLPLHLDELHCASLWPHATPVALCPNARDDSAEEDNHRRVVDPDQNDGERPGCAVGVSWIRVAKVVADDRLADDEEECAGHCADPDVWPDD